MKTGRTIISLLLILILPALSKAQTTLNRYQSFDISNSSCEAFNAVNLELSSSTYSRNYDALRQSKQKALPLHNQDNVSTFIDEFNTTLGKTKKKYESEEFLWKTGSELGKYGLSVLGNYAQALPTKNLTNFLTPAIQQGYALYVDSEIQNGIDEHKDDIDQLIKNRINLLYSNGIDVRSSTDEAAFNSMFALAHGDIPALDRNQYGIFNKELTKRAYDFLKTNRENMKILDLKLTQQYEDIKQQTNSKIELFEKQITTDVNSRFKELGNSIAELAKNQTYIFKKLNDIQDRIVINEKRISLLEREMLLVQGDIKLLKVKQDEHDKLISQNSFQIDILSGYSFQNLNTNQKINALEKGHFDNIFNEEDKKKLLGDLRDIRTKETIISVSSDIENYSKSAYGGLVNAGIIKGKAAQNVGKFISAVSILTGVARVYAGDISGLTSIISGLGGLFSKPQPSAEMQMLTQMYEVMNQRFDKIDQHLGIIEGKIDTLASITISMYKTMVLSFQYTGNQLDRINRKTDYLLNKSSYLIFKDYKNCLDQAATWKANSVKFDSYSDILKNFNPVCQKCLDGLNDFLAGEGVQAPFFLSANPNYKNIDVIDFEVNSVFNPSSRLFSIFYDTKNSSSIYALMFPFSLTKDSNKPIFYLNKMTNLSDINSELVFKEYYNYQLINEVADNLLIFSPYYETQGNGASFQPQSFINFISNNSINANNQSLQEKRLIKLLNMVKYAIAQQSMLSGNLMLDPIYSTLFSYSSNEEAKDLAIKVLVNNRLLSTNFATYLVNKNINLSDTTKIKKLFESAGSNADSLRSLNSLISINDLSFSVDSENQKLLLSFVRKGTRIDLRCPDFSTILSNRMINSDAIYSLIESRNKINSKLIDLTFSKSLSSIESTKERFKYYYIPSGH